MCVERRFVNIFICVEKMRNLCLGCEKCKLPCVKMIGQLRGSLVQIQRGLTYKRSYLQQVSSFLPPQGGGGGAKEGKMTWPLTNLRFFPPSTLPHPPFNPPFSPLPAPSAVRAITTTPNIFKLYWQMLESNPPHKKYRYG